MDKTSKILITGSHGMVGTSLINKLRKNGYNNLLTPSSSELDLRDQKITEKYFAENKIDYVIHLAAKVGGIMANIKFSADFLYDNMTIGLNVIENSKKYDIKKLLYLGSSCIYPRECKQPMKEEYLLAGNLEPTNEGYALAKISGLKLCEYYNKQHGTNFISLVDCNLYGPNDHFDPNSSHVIPALILKFHDAKEKKLPFVEIWGTGKSRREFLYIEDATDAILYFMLNYDWDELRPFLNIGLGTDVSITELALLIKDIVGYNGKIKFDASKPDGMPRKLVDVSRATKFGWKAKVSLKEGIKKTYEWFKERKNG